jgi:hypothetical protein
VCPLGRKAGRTVKTRLCPVCRQPLSNERMVAEVEKHLAALDRRARANIEGELRKARLEGEHKERARLARARVAMSKRVQGMQSRMARLQKEAVALRAQAAEKATSSDKGALGESEVLDALRRAFPMDLVEPLNKTRGSGDIKHEVREKGETRGLIVYECKNVQTWDSKFVEQARALRVTYGTQHVVLVSTAFPAKERDVAMVGGVPVVHPELVVHVVKFIREAVVLLGQREHTSDERDRKAAQILEYIVSDAFVVQMKRVVEATTALQDMQRRERDVHNRTWTEQTRYYKLLEDGSAAVRGEIDAILNGPTTTPPPEKANGNGHAHAAIPPAV